MKNTFQIVDSPKRDLEWRLLLAFKLLKSDISSFIGSAQNVRSKFLLNGGVVVGRLGGTSGRSKFDSIFLNEIEKLGGKIFYFHDEGGAFRVNGYERESRLAYPSELCEKSVFERIYFWGQAQRHIFDKEKWIKKARVLGCPRFDLYQNSRSDKDLSNQYILINTRFSNVQTVKDDPSSLSKRMLEIRIEGGELNNKTESEIIENMYHRWKTSAKDFVAFVEMIARVCLRYKNQKFLLRPHPAEDVEWYRKNFELLDNLKIDNNGDVKNVFSKTKLLLHSECTTGLEAELQRIPNVNYIPFPEEQGEGVVGLRSIGAVCHDIESVCSSIDEFLENEDAFFDKFSKEDREIEHYISNLNNLGYATDMLVSDIAEFYLNNQNKLTVNYMYGVRVAIFNVLRNIKNGIKYRNVSKKNMWPSKNEILGKWIELGGKKSDIKIGNGLIEIGIR